ncbi:MAG: hypothetical protein A2W11_06175 [Ignavibacteria bacterium RBG_16_35_7]|nr:MAG: hypothetical protein A2W11_06175 [Ignavibacteria bacterium RBG_16_35_7]
MKLNDFKSVGAVITLYLLFVFTLVFAFICFGEVKTANKDFFNIALMALVGWVAGGIGYYLGSSNSSAKKSETIANLTSTSEGEN